MENLQYVGLKLHFRSKLSSIQLVSLVSSRDWKEFGNEACNLKLVEDLKTLEDIGVEVTRPVKKTVKAGLCYIVGDNLGQHALAEMSQCFSSGMICRWCCSTYKDCCEKGNCFEGRGGYCAPRTSKGWYDEQVVRAEQGETTESGIKGRCVFNRCKSFHNIGQQPPCLGWGVKAKLMHRDLLNVFLLLS